MGVVRRSLRGLLRRVKQWLEEEGNGLLSQIPSAEPPSVPFDNSDEWLSVAIEKLMKEPVCSKRPQYIWGVLQGASLGKVLGMQRISVIEFGVAGGAGLIALEHIAQRCAEILDMKIEVYGFDSGSGLPKARDFRDCPYLWVEGQFRIDEEELKKRLRRASLKMGLVNETVPAFIQASPPPVAFVAFDLDLYSSTKEALELLDAGHHLLLPRIACYFDDIMNRGSNEFAGERLAISEFNSMHPTRKLSLLHGLTYFLPPKSYSGFWSQKCFMAYIFDHPLYNVPDSNKKVMIIDLEGQCIEGQVITRSDPSREPRETDSKRSEG
jgi:hypothetical protein